MRIGLQHDAPLVPLDDAIEQAHGALVRDQ